MHLGAAHPTRGESRFEMKITQNTGSYNDRRYGKPWIAKISLEGNNLKFHFGTWCGDPGDEGILILDGIEPGEFYAKGQKDFRQPRNSTPVCYRATAEGKGESVSKPEVFKALAGV